MSCVLVQFNEIYQRNFFPLSECQLYEKFDGMLKISVEAAFGKLQKAYVVIWGNVSFEMYAFKVRSFNFNPFLYVLILKHSE